MANEISQEKANAAQAAADLVEDGMLVGLGTGSTVSFLLPALSQRQRAIRCVSTSPRTEEAARQLGLRVEPFTNIAKLDIAIDGADQIAADGWLIKGGGGAHTREKLVAYAADRFIVIADSAKQVAQLHVPIPLELLSFGLDSTLHRLGNVQLRQVPRSPDGGVIADYYGPIGSAFKLAATFSGTPGIIEHGLFPPHMVSLAIIGHQDGVTTLTFPTETDT